MGERKGIMVLGVGSLRVKLLRPGAVAPTRATDGSAGYDLYLPRDAPADSDGVVLLNGLVGTGVAIEIPPGWVGLLRPRSSISKTGTITYEGTIDSDYRGEVMARFAAFGWQVLAKPGERIAQLVIVPCLTAPVEVVETLSDTARGAGGFGSTGK